MSVLDQVAVCKEGLEVVMRAIMQSDLARDYLTDMARVKIADRLIGMIDHDGDPTTSKKVLKVIIKLFEPLKDLEALSEA